MAGADAADRVVDAGKDPTDLQEEIQQDLKLAKEHHDDIRAAFDRGGLAEAKALAKERADNPNDVDLDSDDGDAALAALLASLGISAGLGDDDDEEETA